jgi:N-acetylglucosaminyldiphosphoundecaprenol N-acetyl-beta-D-mannosaminyltransferase
MGQDRSQEAAKGIMTVVHDDLSREVYGVLGIPLDRTDMPTILQSIEVAIDRTEPFLISTPNLNFMVNSWLDPEFRESLLFSDLCSVDGMPVVWLARLLGAPIKQRIAGSDIYDALKQLRPATNPLKVYLFGAADGVAESAGRKLNAASGGMICVGFHYPAFGSVDEMSNDALINEINASKADLFIAALGAKKGQLWLKKNHHSLRTPVRAHLGAVINIQAGEIRRAPLRLRNWGLEWLWRIKEEPKLWRRYWDDGRMLMVVFVTRALPLAVSIRWRRVKNRHQDTALSIEQIENHGATIIKLFGEATAEHVSKTTSYFRAALTARKRIVIDLSSTEFIDARFIGLLLMLRKTLNECDLDFELTGVTPLVRRVMCRNGFGFLLAGDPKASGRAQSGHA